MIEPSTDEKTRETHFWVHPENAGQKLVKTSTAGSIDFSRSGVSNRLAFFKQVVELRVLAGLKAVPVAFDNELARGTKFLFLPVFAGAGAVTYFNAAAEPRLSPIVLGITAIAGCYLLAQNRTAIRFVLLFLIAFAIGLLCAKLETIRAATPMLGSEVTTRVTGRISALSRDAKGGWRVVLDVIATERPSLRFGPDRIAVSARHLPRNLSIGDGLKALVHLRPQSGPVRPGNYDFAFYNYYRGIGANGFFLGMPEKVNVEPKSGILAAGFLVVSNVRQQLTQRILQNIKGEPGDIATSLVTGQRDGISDETNNAMRMSGLSHILSISGLHMALVAAIIIGTLRTIFALFPGVCARYPVKKLAAVAALCGSAFYLTLSGADVAAQRSFVMLAVMLLAMAVDRAAISMRNLAIAACITIAVSPHEVLGPGFQMSYSATAALIAFYGWWSHRRTKSGLRNRPGLWFLPSKAAGYIGGIAMTSLVAGSVSSIFAAYHFNNTAPFGLIGNAIALPVVSIVVMPFAVFGLLAMPFDLEWLPFTVMGWGIEMVIVIAKAVTSHSPSGNFGSVSGVSLAFMTVALVLLLFLSTRLRLLALPFIVAAVVMTGHISEPVIMISEDGKLVAIRTEDDQLAINRQAGSVFNLNNWQQGYAATQIVKPAGRGDISSGSQFECIDGFCTAREPGGLVVAYADDAKRMADACDEGDIVILAFAAEVLGCANETAIVLSKRDLALKGAAEIRFDSSKLHSPKADPPLSGIALATDALSKRLASVEIRHAIGVPNRPWNAYRIYSRNARNLDERRRGKKDPQATEPM
ncbi:ComEC/Rec2 family competence protein [Phyllobacterium sp. YR531]|uniref:ComEC/Rec2 family competence protein n=1 Tax=Phyllobacterium sp. YR531 TaxID=1144343 RepID=UPI00026FA1F9|nr:ComEC/Rec2 family competence protein [Phyllobacterium sp. YR531]EJM98069.1 ComEC/Rec2-related protein [Phyllobacterium sp. YR531]